MAQVQFAHALALAFIAQPAEEAGDAVSLQVVPAAPLKGATSGDKIKKTARRSIELVVFDKTSKRRFIRPCHDSARADEFLTAHLKWEADIARRKVERRSPTDPVNVMTDRILGQKAAKERPMKSE